MLLLYNFLLVPKRLDIFDEKVSPLFEIRSTVPLTVVILVNQLLFQNNIYCPFNSCYPSESTVVPKARREALLYV